MSETSTTTLSSRGQVVIPQAIRDRLGLKAGAQFVVLGQNDLVIFKLLEPPARSDFAELVQEARRVAGRSGIRRRDVAKAVTKARRGT